MQISSKWLRSLVSLDLLTDQGIVDTLCAHGIESQFEPVLKSSFSDVVVVRIEACSPHPDADKLQLCQVTDGTNQFEIVCGAPNARAGLVTALAKVGALLPHNFKIKARAIRGVESAGMLCSAKELGINEALTDDGILELWDDLTLGENLITALSLDDSIITLEITPNRSDVLSALGLLREIMAITDCSLTQEGQALMALGSQAPSYSESKNWNIEIDSQLIAQVPSYHMALMTDIDPALSLPTWMKVRLMRADIALRHPVVDVLNYVMLELGQPLHAFDFSKMESVLTLTYSKRDETFEALNGKSWKLDDSTLVLRENKSQDVLALPGLIGGSKASINVETKNILIESAFFLPAVIAGKSKYYGCPTDASYRFERGVDFQLPLKAMVRAINLIETYLSGRVQSEHSALKTDLLPARLPIELNTDYVNKLLGVMIENVSQQALLEKQFVVESIDENRFSVISPSYRFDLEKPIDLVEEIARLYGYNRLVGDDNQEMSMRLDLTANANQNYQIERLVDFMVAMGFQETMHYSFVNKKGLEAFSSNAPIVLSNPMNQTMSVMRTSLIPSLVLSAHDNMKRYQQPIFLFETANVYQNNQEKIHLAACASEPQGASYWHSEESCYDFYQLKRLLGRIERQLGVSFHFKTDHLTTGWHPHQALSIWHEQSYIGTIGALNPKTVVDFCGHKQSAYYWLFEIELDGLLLAKKKPNYQFYSRQPISYRDFSFVLLKETPYQVLETLIYQHGGPYLRLVRLFDLYEGEGILPDQKSLSVRIGWQAQDKTLQDDALDFTIGQMIEHLESAHIVIRS